MKRSLLVSILVLIIVFASVTSAFAWANGADTNDDGRGDDGFGTHDWILDQAIQLAGASGSWIQTETALFATDDPDTVYRDTSNHFYDNTRKGQGAPQTVADLYDDILIAYQAGDFASASRDLGLLSHYYSDVCQPFHTLWYADDDDEHVDYEYAVNAYTNRQGENRAWVTPRDRTQVGDVRRMTISAATSARTDYFTLRSAFVPGDAASLADDFDASTTNAVGIVTRRRLSRAVNDLADIIAAIPSGQGRAPQALVRSLKLSRRYVGTSSDVVATATVVDPTGEPVRGARVIFTWAFSSGAMNSTAYTNSSGIATLTQTLPDEALWYRIDVFARASTNGTSSTAGQWALTTPKVRSIKTTMSSTKPKQKTKVTATTRLIDSAGLPIPYHPVTVAWRFKTKTYRYVRYTDANGVVKTSRNIGKASTKYRARVTATTDCGGEIRSASTYFTPKKPKAKKK